MGKIDIATKELLKNDDVMRDLIKLSMPGVRTDDLKLSPMDGESTLTLFDYEKEHAITAALKRLCDVRRLVTTVTDGNWQYVIIGVENQANEDNAMPFRVLLENVMGYLEQIVMLADKNRKEEQERRRAKKEIEKRAEAAGPEAAEEAKEEIRQLGTPMTFQERLSWLKASDRLKPIITIVVYWSDDKWKGPLHLHDMIDIPHGLEPFVDNNSIFLVQPSALTDEELEQCDSELGLIFRAIKSGNLEKLARNDDRYQSISSAAANVIEAVVGGMGDLLSKNANQKGVVNMTRTMQAYSESLIKQGEEKMKPRITALEQKTTALEQQANEANQKASAAEQKATAAEQKATAAEQKATAAEQKANAAEQRATAAEQEANEANQKVASLEEKQRTSELAYRRLMSVNRMIAQGKSRTEIIKTLFLNDDEAAEWLVDVQ